MTLVPQVEMSPNGAVFSKIIQGYWRMAEWPMNTQQHLSFIKQHIELGITTVDHAHVYGNPPCESLFGKALKLDATLRDQIEIVSKCGVEFREPAKDGSRTAYYDCSAANIIASVDISLNRLATDYLDVLLIHRPDFLLDAEQVAVAFDKLQTSGKVKYFGVSNFTPMQFSLLQSFLNNPLVTNQVEINPINFAVAENGILDQLQQLRVLPMAWSCLAGGKIFSEPSEQAERLRQTLRSLQDEIGAETIEQVIYTWVMCLPSKPVVILGTGNINRVRSAIKALNLSMNREQWYRVWVASKGHTVP